MQENVLLRVLGCQGCAGFLKFSGGARPSQPLALEISQTLFLNSVQGDPKPSPVASGKLRDYQARNFRIAQLLASRDDGMTINGFVVRPYDHRPASTKFANAVLNICDKSRCFLTEHAFLLPQLTYGAIFQPRLSRRVNVAEEPVNRTLTGWYNPETTNF